MGAANMKGHVTCSKITLGPLVSCKVRSEQTSLEIYPFYGSQPMEKQFQVLALLLAARARMDATTRDQQTALHFAARSGAPGALVEELLAAPVWRGKGKKGRSPGGHEALKLDVQSSVRSDVAVAFPCCSRHSMKMS